MKTSLQAWVNSVYTANNQWLEITSGNERKSSRYLVNTYSCTIGIVKCDKHMSRYLVISLLELPV